MDREIADVIRKRAEELEETGKGIAHRSGSPNGVQTVDNRTPITTTTEVTRKEIEAQCSECYQKVTLPQGTNTFKCEICGKTQNV